MATIENNVLYTYSVDGEEKTVSASCTIEKQVTEPPVSITKTGWPDPAKKGDTITYRVDITIGDGDTFTDVQKLVDISNGLAEFVVGSLTLDGEPVDVPDLSNIVINFLPNSYHYLEYNMVCL